MKDQFAIDVDRGLSSRPKYLPSKYFYDKQGDKLFQEIMNLPEYYLTRSEFEIFDQHKSTMLQSFRQNGRPFDLIEFGAGDGIKTKVILEHFLQENTNFKYYPIDISANIIHSLSEDLNRSLPALQFEGLVDDYFNALARLNHVDHNPKVILFLGSNIGNFTESQANHFLSHMHGLMRTGDKLMIGFDLKKDPRVIKAAYNDAQGVTRAFNLNLLKRINAELEANFDLTKFIHQPTYNPETGEAKSYILSIQDQDVHITATNTTYHFSAWESIFVEVSQKYDHDYISRLARHNGFKIGDNLYDCKHYYVDSVWEKGG